MGRMLMTYDRHSVATSSQIARWEFGREWPDDSRVLSTGKTAKDRFMGFLLALPALVVVGGFAGLIIFGIVNGSGAAGGCGGG
jgi:hypothetical protein